MKKLLSLLCAVTLIVTCMASLAVSAEVSYPVEASLINAELQPVAADKAVWGGYEHSKLSVPEGWGWRISENINSAADDTNRRVLVDRVVGQQPQNEKTLILYSSDVYFTTIFDVEPGFTYSIDVDAILPVGAKYVVGAKYWLLHKNLDGTYSDINDFLTQWEYENTNLANATGEVVMNGSQINTETATHPWAGDTSMYCTPLSLEVSVTDLSVDAIMVGLGGNTGMTTNSGFGVYRKVTLDKGEAVEIVENNGKEETVVYYNQETFTADGFETKQVAWTDMDGVSYNHPVDVPTGFEPYVTADENYNYEQASEITDAAKRASVVTLDDGKTYLAMAGSDLAITKMVDIEPGYNYKLWTNMYALYGASRSALSYQFYHKDEEGNYTPINDYFKENGLAPVVDKVTEIFNSTYADTTEWNGSTTAKKGTITLNFAVKSNKINAVKVFLGGYGGNSTNQNFRVYHDGFVLDQGETEKIVPDKVIYYEEEFSKEYTEEEFVYEFEEVEYTNTVQIPNGWGYTTEGDSPYLASASKTFISYNTKPYENGYNVFGSWVGLSKVLEVEPGYTYTVTTTAATAGKVKVNRVNTEVILGHVDEDGTFTEINEYLEKGKYENYPLEGASALCQLYSDDMAGEAIDDVYYDASHSVTVSITDENINAIKINLGNRNGQGPNNYGIYKGITVTKDEAVSVIPNNPCYYREVFTDEYTEETIVTEYNGTEYENTLHLPVGWGWTMEDAQYPEQMMQQKKFISYDDMTYNPQIAYSIYGSWVGLTKMIDIEPGYEYTVKTSGATYRSANQNRLNTRIKLYHKNADGTYTEINEYLAENGFQNSAIESTAITQIYNESQTGAGFNTYFYDATHSVSIKVTDASVDAIKIILGGECGQGYNNYGIYKGIAVIQGEKVDLIANNQPPYLTLETVEDEKIVRYTPKAGSTNVPTIVIAAYEVAEDGTLTLAKTSIVKNEKTEDGYFEAPYDLDLSGLTGTVKVKAFAWDFTKALPLTKVLTIQ